MTRVKVCGITNLEDARAAVELGAHALGFIWVPDTPRYVGGRPEALRAAASVPPFVCRVAVYRHLDDAGGNPDDFWFDAVQFYEAGPTSTFPPGRRAVQAIRLRDARALDEKAARPNAHAFLLDAYHPAKLGGSGETCDWGLAREAKERLGKPIILAGGLTPENVGDAITAVRPYAVDVSGGVEAEPGRKDHAKLRAFFEAVRRADAALGG